MKNISWLYFEKICRLFISLLISGYVSRALGSKSFGLLQLSIAYAGIFISISSLGFPQVSLKYLANDKIDSKKFIGSAIAISFFCGLLLFILGVLIACLLFANKGLLVAICSIQLLQLFVRWPLLFGYWFDSKILSKYTVICNTVAYLSSVLCQVFILITSQNLVLLVLACLIEPVLFGVLIIFTSASKKFDVFALSYSGRTTRQILKEVFPFFLTSIAVSIYVRIDQVMLGSIIGDESVGFYSISARLSETLVFVSSAIINTSFPSIVKKYNEKPSESDVLFKKVAKCILPLSSLLCTIIFLFAEQIILLIYGQEYLPACASLRPLAFAGLFISFGTLRTKYLVLRGFQILQTYLLILGAILNASLNSLLIPHYSTVGAAYATMITLISITMIFPWFSHRLRRFNVMIFKGLF